MERLFPWTIALVVLLLTAGPARAQGYINQNEIENILQRRTQEIDALPEVYYEYRIFDDPRNNTVLARNTLYKKLGEGDQELGQQRARLIELLNRVTLASSASTSGPIRPSPATIRPRAASASCSSFTSPSRRSRPTSTASWHAGAS